MEERGRQVTENISELIDAVVNNASNESTAALSTISSISSKARFRWSKVDLASGLVIPIVPFLVSIVVIVVLILANRQQRSAVNVFIVNHSAATFLIFLSALSARLIRIGGIDKGYFGDQVIEDVICIFLIGQVVASLGNSAQHIALIIITLELTSRSCTPSLTASTTKPG